MANGPKLVLISTENSGREYPLTKRVTTIGRSPECDIMIEQPSVSRNHARVERFGDHYVASDLGSRNGIRIDDQPVPEGRLHTDGLLAVGEVVFRAEGLAERTPPPPPPHSALGRRADENPTPAPLAPEQAPDEHGPPPEASRGEETGVPLRPAASPQQQALAEQAARFGPALVVALAVLFSTGALYAAWRVFGGGQNEPLVMNLSPVKVRVNENYWAHIWGTVDLNGRTISQSADIEAGSIAMDPPGIAQVERFGERELVVTGLSYGDTVATMRTPIGNLVRVRILVRGRLDTPDQGLRREVASPSERIETAEKRIEAGDILMDRGAPFRAQQEYERAALHVEGIQRARPIHVEARRKAREAEAEVRRRYEELDRSAELARRTGNYEAALSALRRIVALIPDTNDPRNQRARYHAVTWEMAEGERRR